MVNGITPSDTQAAAISAIVDWYKDPFSQPVFYLAGYAGTGKSTVANFAINELREKCGIDTVPTGAFTGKAASVLRKKGVHNATTIHSMIYSVREDKETGKPVFALNVLGPAADADMIVLDEVSMVDQELADDVLSFGKKLLVMGDPGQLPPVRGQGAFTAKKPDLFLTEIHRQAAESPIIRLATMARKGERIPVGDYGDDVVSKRLTKASSNDVYAADTKPICGIHRVRWTITAQMRQRLNYHGSRPRPGETLMCRRNSRAEGIYNGQEGLLRTITELEPNGPFRIRADMEDMTAPIDDVIVHPWLFDQHVTGKSERPRIPKWMHEFDFGYVLTCHAAQGSEWPHVTIVDDSGSFRDEAPRWLYTAITRASEGLTLLQRD